MPIKSAKYRYVKKKGKKGRGRLAWADGKVVEAKNTKTGATHTPAEFKADRKKAAARRRRKARKSK